MTLDYGYHVFALAVHFLGDVEKIFAYITQQKIVHDWILDSPGMMIWKHKDAGRQPLASQGSLCPPRSNAESNFTSDLS